MFRHQKGGTIFQGTENSFSAIDIHRFGMSKSVFESAKRCTDVEDMIDRKAKAYKDLYMDYIDEKKREGTLFENPALFRTPIVRNGKEFTLGYCPDVWKNWE